MFLIAGVFVLFGCFCICAIQFEIEEAVEGCVAVWEYVKQRQQSSISIHFGLSPQTLTHKSVRSKDKHEAVSRPTHQTQQQPHVPSHSHSFLMHFGSFLFVHISFILHSFKFISCKTHIHIHLLIFRQSIMFASAVA